MKNKLTIGLTGNIASGKSTVAAILKELGAQVIDADQVARQVVAKGEPALEELVIIFGDRILMPDGTLNRNKMGELAFSNYDNLRALNDITHPRIRQIICQSVEEFRLQTNYSILVIEASLLFETGLDQMVDQIWFVDTSVELQLERLMNRNGFTKKEALQRIDAQNSPDPKRKKSHVVISNTGDLSKLASKVKDFYEAALNQ